MNWQFLISLATIFFVLGQVCLKYDTSNNPFQTLFYFSFTMGVLGLCGLLSNNIYRDRSKNVIPWVIILAGFLFFCGNGLWIAGIQKAENIGLLRVFMAALETVLLLFASYIMFNATITYKDMIAIGVIMFGIYLLNN